MPNETRETAAPVWSAWKRHLLRCADCTAGNVCAEGRGWLNGASPSDAPWLRAAPNETAAAVNDAQGLDLDAIDALHEHCIIRAQRTMDAKSAEWRRRARALSALVVRVDGHDRAALRAQRAADSGEIERIDRIMREARAQVMPRVEIERQGERIGADVLNMVLHATEPTGAGPARDFGELFDMLSRRDPTLNGSLYEEPAFAERCARIYAALGPAATEAAR